MDTWRMEFSGRLLRRGFWLYIWDIKHDKSRHLYVGRTGDSSSANASSPFRRIGQHLETKVNAKGNALGRCLKRAGIHAESCIFKMTAVGPLFDEEKTFQAHVIPRDKTAALERALADELRKRGYKILGDHPRAGSFDESLFEEILTLINDTFPPLPGSSAA